MNSKLTIGTYLPAGISTEVYPCFFALTPSRIVCWCTKYDRSGGISLRTTTWIRHKMGSAIFCPVLSATPLHRQSWSDSKRFWCPRLFWSRTFSSFHIWRMSLRNQGIHSRLCILFLQGKALWSISRSCARDSPLVQSSLHTLLLL